MTPLVPCSRSRVPRGTDLSERPGARDLAPGSHRLGALGPPERRSGRVRSAAMAPAGKGRRQAGAAGQQRRGRWGVQPSPARPGQSQIQTWTYGRCSGSAASQGSGFRCYCVISARPSDAQRRAEAALLPAPAGRGRRRLARTVQKGRICA